MFRIKFMLGLCALLALGACSTTTSNSTVFPYQIDQEALAQQPVKRIVVATANFSGEPTRQYLQSGARRINAMVKEHLSRNGYELVPDYVFDNAWNQAIRTYGNMYDPTTGRVDPDTWRAVMITTATALRERGDIDAIVFADVIEHDVQHSFGMQHYARWWGVTRKPALQGPGDGVPADFDWGQQIKGASLWVNIYSMELEPLFSSRGGLDVLQAIDMKMSNPAFVRRKKLLDNSANLEEGIALAFHPFIPMKKYPGPSPEERAAASLQANTAQTGDATGE